MKMEIESEPTVTLTLSLRQFRLIEDTLNVADNNFVTFEDEYALDNVTTQEVAELWTELWTLYKTVVLGDHE